MNKLTLRKKTNVIIFVSFISILIFFPFQESFIGGLLFAAFIAATIGGLADSFAVNALFGQPLKIKWPSWMGTRIIARNRDRLISELVEMVEQELLSTEMINKQLKHYDASKTVMSYLQSHDGKKQLKLAIHTLLSDLLKVTNPVVLKQGIVRFAEQGAGSIPFSSLLRQVLQWGLHQGYDESVVTVAVKQLSHFIETDRCRHILAQFIAKALLTYEQNKKGRQFVNGVAGLNAEELSEKVQSIALKYLEQLNDVHHPLRTKISELLQGYVDQLQSDEAVQLKVDEIFRSFIKYATNAWITQEKIASIITSLIAQLEEREQSSSVLDWVDQKLQHIIDALNGDERRLEQLNVYIRTAMTTFVERNHRYIGGVVRQKLDSFSEQELIELVQEKAGKDLQYIRINGIVIGAFIGIVLFLIHRVIGGIIG